MHRDWAGIELVGNGSQRVFDRRRDVEIEAVLNHSSGHRAGVAGVYNRARYLGEMKAALDQGLC